MSIVELSLETFLEVGIKYIFCFNTKEYLFSNHKTIRPSTHNNIYIEPMFQIEALSIVKAMWWGLKKFWAKTGVVEIFNTRERRGRIMDIISASITSQ